MPSNDFRHAVRQKRFLIKMLWLMQDGNVVA
jgi:hypothetical protein